MAYGLAPYLSMAKKKKVAQYADFATMEARALWSVPNHMAMNAIANSWRAGKNAHLKKEVQENREIVAKRASIFLQEAKIEGLILIPIAQASS
jgi:hypothetical protein